MAEQSKSLNERIGAIRNWNDYDRHRQAAEAAEFLTNYYKRNPKKADDMKDSNPEVIDAKKKLISTLYSTLNGVEGRKVPVAYAHNRRINHVFKGYFLKKDDKTCVYRHMAEVVNNIYASRISDYQERMLTSTPTAPLTDLISGERIARINKNPALAERLHQTIDDRFEAAPMAEFEQTAKIFKNNILMQYQQYCWRTEEFKKYLNSKHTPQEAQSGKAKSSQPALQYPEAK